MKRMAWIGIVCIAATASAAPLRDAKEDVKAAAKKLGDAGNYSWTATIKNNADTGAAPPRFAMGPVEGKADKDGSVWVSTKMGENSIEAVMKGEKFAVKTADGWKGSAELPAGGQQGQPNPAMFAGRFLRNVKPPAASVSEVVEKLKELKSEGDGVYSGEFTDEGAKETISPPRPAGAPAGGNFQPPQVSDAKASIKIWVKDGQLSKIETTVTGKMTIRDQERTINRTTTVEIKDVGSTKIELPDEAKKKLE
jgi:hypothetical protein